MTRKNNDARSPKEIAGTITDADLNHVSGGGDLTAQPAATAHLAVKLEPVRITSYQLG